MIDDPDAINEKVRRILLHARATPLKGGKSPAELYLNRKIRIRLDAIQPVVRPKNATNKQPVRVLFPGQRVTARYYNNNKPEWKFAVIQKRLGKLHYPVKLDSRYVLKRHIDHLRGTNV